MSDDKRPIPLSDLLALTDPGLSPERRAALTARLSNDTDRARLVGLVSLKNALKKSAPALPTPFELTDACIPTDEMGDFLGGRMPETERRRYATHVAECDPCFERAAFFTTSSAAMTGGMMTMEKTPAHFKAAILPNGSSSVDNVIPLMASQPSRKGIGRWLASPVTAYALAATLLVALVTGGNGPNVTPYESDAGFSLYETDPTGGPSFGFADTGRLVGEQEAGLTVTGDGDGGVTLSWAPVEGADRYLIAVSRLTPKGPRDLLEMSATEPSVAIPADKLAAGELYRYRIAGTTGDRLFVATGQFGLTE